jgi:hypothetical protein
MRKLSVKRHLVTQPLSESYRIIPLTQGQNAIVDASDYDWLSQWNWYALWAAHTKSFYAVRHDAPCSPTIRMHRLILNCGKDEEVDHRDHDTLNNRRCNLRKCTGTQNAINRRMRSNNTSGFKGVCWDKKSQKWRSYINANGVRRNLGLFTRKELAAAAYIGAAKELHKDFACL